MTQDAKDASTLPPVTGRMLDAPSFARTTSSPTNPTGLIHEPENVKRAFWRLLTRFDRNKMSPHRALRNTLGVVLPLIVGYALDMPRGGLAVASGALNVAYSDGPDSYSDRAKRMLLSSVLCASAVFAGAISGQHTIPAVILATIVAFIAGMMVAISVTAADLGVISLVLLLVYAAQPLTPKQAVLSGILAFSGGLLQTSLSIALWPIQRYDPERRALGNLFAELANVAQHPSATTITPAATFESLQAQEALSGLGRDETMEGVRYRALLNQAERIRLSLLMLARLRLRLERESPGHAGAKAFDQIFEKTAKILQSMAECLLSGKAPSLTQEDFAAIDETKAQLQNLTAIVASGFLMAVLKDANFQAEALVGQLRAALDLSIHSSSAGQIQFAKQEARQPWWLRFNSKLATLRANLDLQSSTCRHAIRLAVMMAIGELLGRELSWQRSYWLPMTIVLVLKPEFTATFSRGVLRIGGTIAGLLLATALFHFLPVHVTAEIALIFIFTLLLRWFGPANYGVFTVAVSALIVLLISITGITPKEVIWARGINTVTGGALALVAYWLWPTWERTHISERIAQMLDAYCEYFHWLTQSYVQTNEKSARELDHTRLKARVARSNLEAAIDRLGAEPGSTAEQMNRLNASLASSHRFIHAVMALDAVSLRTPPAPARQAFIAFAADVERTLSLLSGALRQTRVLSKDLPDLREDHTRLVQSSDSQTERYALVNIETDRITNSLNTLREQIMDWTRQEIRTGPASKTA